MTGFCPEARGGPDDPPQWSLRASNFFYENCFLSLKSLCTLREERKYGARLKEITLRFMGGGLSHRLILLGFISSLLSLGFRSSSRKSLLLPSMNSFVFLTLSET